MAVKFPASMRLLALAVIVVASWSTVLSSVSLTLGRPFSQRRTFVDAAVRWKRSEVYGSHSTRVLFATYTDRPSEGVCVSMLTAALQGIELLVMGLDRQISELDFSHVRNVKTRKLLAFIQLLTSDNLKRLYGIGKDVELVVLTDATDVLYLSPVKQILSKYEEITQTTAKRGKSVVVGVERNCWPQMNGKRQRLWGGRRFCAQFDALMNAEKTSYKYPNSGGFAGPPSALAVALADIRSGMLHVNEDDQRCTQRAILRRFAETESDSPYSFHLDYESRIFQTGWGSNIGSDCYNCSDSVGAYFNAATQLIENTEHRTEPAMVHFNGDKVAVKPLARDMLRYFEPRALSSSEREEVLRILQNYSRTHAMWFDALCTEYADVVRGKLGSAQL